MQNPFKDFTLKIDNERSALLICIGVAFLIWFFLKLSKDYETDKNIYIEYALPSMMEFTETPPSSLVATLHGTGFQLVKKFLLHRRPTISIDLTQFPKTEVQRSLLIWKIQEETGMTVQNINLDYLNFTVDSTATKKVPIELDLEIVYEEDFFAIQPIKVSHDSITLAGPMQELEQITSVRTERTVFAPIHGNVEKTIAINMEGFKHITHQPEEIKVEIFAEQFTEKSFKIPVTVVGAPTDFQILPTSVHVSCAVGLSHFEALVADSFLIEADLGQAIKLGDEKNVPVNLKGSPSWIKSPRISPKIVEYVLIK